MIEVVQAGQAGKTRLLFDMHRLRKRVFLDRMQWPVTITGDGLEVDQFDLPDTIYLLSLDHNAHVIGSWRLLPTTGPTMIRDVWPEFLATLPMTTDPFVWEASRFAVDSPAHNKNEGLGQVHHATSELFCGLTELCIMCGIKQIYTLYDMRIARLLRRLDCTPKDVSEKKRIDQHMVEVGVFDTNEQMLAQLRRATGLTQPLIDHSDLPPALEMLRNRPQTHLLREREYSHG